VSVFFAPLQIDLFFPAPAAIRPDASTASAKHPTRPSSPQYGGPLQTSTPLGGKQMLGDRYASMRVTAPKRQLELDGGRQSPSSKQTRADQLPYVCMLGCTRAMYATRVELRQHIRERHQDIYSTTAQSTAKGLFGL
jgi:hypothetical protein